MSLRGATHMPRGDADKKHARTKSPSSRASQKQQTLVFADGGQYVGDVVNGFMHGRGTLTEAGGRTFLGEFRNGSMVEGAQFTVTFPMLMREFTRAPGQTRPTVLWVRVP